MISFARFINEVATTPSTKTGARDGSKIVNGSVPSNLLVPIDSMGNKLVGSAAAAFQRAQRDCQASTGKQLTLAGPNSSFRTIEQQNMMYKQYGPGQAATPGKSNHGFGLAIDLKKDEAWEWFVQNSSKYGFKQLNNTNEKHHFDYVGNVAEYQGKQRLFGDESQAPPSTQGSPEEKEEPSVASAGKKAASTATTATDTGSDMESALSSIKTGIKDLFNV